VTAEVLLGFAAGAVAPPAGTAVLAEILIAEVPEALVVPTSAILRGDGAPHVLVAGADNRVVRRDVRVGLITPDQSQITQGLSVGEFVITSALTELKEGDLVSFSRGS
jgi:multidrug efflux pump subunit AcrA (membrane-fusion protein)